MHAILVNNFRTFLDHITVSNCLYFPNIGFLQPVALLLDVSRLWVAFCRISPSDGDSVGSDPSSDRESPKENPRLSGDSKQPRKMAANGLNGKPSFPLREQ